ncbi:hypothetical protein JMJ55_25340 [Belnapia sp. T6]|uniref:Transposase Tn5-like N-terminal domain-containing protein n=1 Tax=Belnapia mucosa TaxID=2804532 RepID=A0ABS1VAF6_9PROT|nr:hypothetical protein [Belnapia mucosa]
MRAGTSSSEAAWQEDELSAATLLDKRLARRLRRLLDQLSAALGKPIPAACGDWAATKAAYCFFDNPRVTEHSVLAGHFAATAARIAACRTRPSSSTAARSRERSALPKPSMPGATKLAAQCANLMRDADALEPAVTLAGTPIGLTAVKFWTRSRFKGRSRSSGTSNPRAYRSRRRKAIDG